MTLGLIFLWANQLLYVIGFIPQIIINHRQRSTAGFSPLMIYLIFCGYVVYTMYSYLLNMPLPLKVMMPVGIGMAGVLAFQQYYFAKNRAALQTMTLSYGVAGFLLSVGVLLGFYYPQEVGNFAGWIGTGIWAVFQIPQIVKIFQEKSVKGFSLGFVLMSGAGAMLELSAALILGLPPQTIVNGIRGLLIVTIFVAQFMLYKNR